MTDFSILSYISTEWNPYPFIYLKPEKGTPCGGASPYREYPLGPIESLCGNGQSVAYTDAHNTESDSENTVSSHSQKLTHYKDSESINQLANEQPAWQAQKWEGKGGGRKAGKSEQEAGAPLPGD